MFAPDYIEAPEPGPELALEPARSIPGIPPSGPFRKSWRPFVPSAHERSATTLWS